MSGHYNRDEPPLAAAVDAAPVRLSLPRRLIARTLSNFMAEAGRWFLWIPVCFGLGIAVYFHLSFEPALWVAMLLIAGTLLPVWLCRAQAACLPLALVVFAVAAGFANATLRTRISAAPVLDKKTYVTARGWVEEARTGRKGWQKLLIRLATIDGRPASKTPYRVRVSSRIKNVRLLAGDAVSFKAILMPPPDPVRPGGFDYARMAWFQRIGATGFLVSAPSKVPLAGAGVWLGLKIAIERWRRGVSQKIMAALPGWRGAVATALVTGERSAVPMKLRQRLRDAGLAHLLAISGLHMALFGGALFVLVRALLALSPALALSFPIKKWAALAALAGTAAYLLLSGAPVSAQRAFIMIAIMFTAIMTDRRALTMRNIAIAALVILLLRPESLLSVSFQMSFAAVVALVSVYEYLRSRFPRSLPAGRWPFLTRKIAVYVAGLALTALVAGAATAPYSLFHFHRMAVYGVIGNMIAVPLMGAVVMPSALLALLAMPLGLEHYPLLILGDALGIIDDVAAFVAALPGAVRLIAAPHEMALPLITCGGLWLLLWRRPWRLAGLAVVALGVILVSAGRSRPIILVERSAANMALRSDQGRLEVLFARKGSYSVSRWLEADGDGRKPSQAVNKTAYSCDPRACIARLPDGMKVAFIRHVAALDEECANDGIVISKRPIRRPCNGARLVIDRFDVWRNGAYSVIARDGRLYARNVRQSRGQRPWVIRRIARHEKRPANRTGKDQ
jgi:competence protein ComEC